jgi:hypothetical protein
MTPSAASPLPAAISRRFEAMVFDWDGTAVPDRSSDATNLRHMVEELCRLGMDLYVVSGTHVGNVDGQLQARPTGPGALFMCMNRGSEVFLIGPDGPELVHRRQATEAEDAALDRAALLTVRRLAARGLRAEIVSQRLNRRKIDLIPEPDWADPPKARIAELVVAVQARLAEHGVGGLPDVVRLAIQAAAEAGLEGSRVTSDAKHVEIGLTDKADSAIWILQDLAIRGISPGLVLIAGDETGPLGGLPGSDSLLLVPEFERATAISVGAEPSGVPEGVLAIGGGPATFVGIIADQIERRRRGDVPSVDEDPLWTLIVEGYDPLIERARSAPLTLADGRIGTTGLPLIGDGSLSPEVLAAGIYDGELPETSLLPCPAWNRLIEDPKGPTGLRRVLDMRSGLLGEWYPGSVSTRSVRFSSMSRPGAAALRVQVREEARSAPDDARGIQPADPVKLELQPALIPPVEGGHLHIEHGHQEGAVWIGVRGSGGGVVAAAADRQLGGGPSLERLAVYHPDPSGSLSPEPALQGLAEAEAAGFDRLLREHREVWGRRWRDADIVIEGDPELQREVRFALFHLMASVADSDEAAVGARGLSGPAYQGHVFWDADVFALPFLAATHPSAARAILEYRVRRLPVAQGAAHALGRAGARFPWESASSGRDVTPTSARDRTGRVVPIRTGLLEEHIVADVAWAAMMYVRWTGDAAFRGGPGRELLVETARYWASRVRFDRGGRAHIYGVIGPDEYHEPVDDSTFTNVMARWNLRAAAAAVQGRRSPVGRPERQRWLEIADALVDGYDPASGIYEEFAGFHRLENIIIRDIAPKRPIAADLLLGRDRVRGAQVLKQADVLMLHHMVREEVVPGSLEPNLRFYEPRTAHGSSLSPGVHAALFARAGRMSEAVEALRLAARMDLDDLTESTSGGLHLATMASVWQAMVFGFAGMWAEEDALRIDPKLPSEWRAMEVRVRFRDVRVFVRVEPSMIHVQTDGPVPVRLGEGTEVMVVEPGGLHVALPTRPATEPAASRRDAREEVT